MIALALALALAQGPDLGPCAAIDRPNPTRAQARAIISCVFRESARQISEGLPTRVDESTTLIGVIAMGTALQYSMRIDVLKAETSSDAIARHEQRVRANVCDTPEMRSTIGYGGSYQYVWFDRRGQRMHSFAIERCPPAAR